MPVLRPVSIVLASLLAFGYFLAIWYPDMTGYTTLAAVVLLLLVILDMALTGNTKNIQIQRIVASKLSLGDPNEVRLVILNRRRFGISGTVGDNAPAEFQVRHARFPFRLASGKSETFSYTITPNRRGLFQFEEVTLRLHGPLGLSSRIWHLPMPKETRAYPSYLQIRKYQLHARRYNVHTVGKRKQRRYGEGREFESLREYTPDDEFRKINWKATARRGKPIVTQFQVERNQNIVLALDAGRMMRSMAGDMSRIDYAINTVLMLTYLCIVKEDNVGLLIFDDQIRTWLPPHRGKAQLSRVNELLYNLNTSFTEPDYGGAFRFLKAKVGRRSLIVLLTDLMDERVSKTMITEFTSLYPKHLPLLTSLRDNVLRNIALSVPGGSQEMMEMAIAQQLLDERLKALRRLQSRGVLTLDANPETLTVEAINKYLDIKARGMI